MSWLDDLRTGLVVLIQLLLFVAAAVVLMGGALALRRMDAASRSEGGVVYVAIAMVVALGAIAAVLRWLHRPRRRSRPRR